MLFLLQLFLLLVQSNLHHVTCSVSEIEINALYDLWTSTQGPKWQYWQNNSQNISFDEGMMGMENIISGQPWNFSSPLSASTPCLPGSARWQGVNCSINNDHITGLFLPTLGLNGTLPVSLCDLFALRSILFAVNILHGAIPSCISRLTALTMFHISNNFISGEIPDGLWDLSQLEWLQLVDNRLTGTLSSGVGNLLQLRMLGLGSNLLSGKLPRELGKLHSVVYAPIGVNFFSGTIPAEIGNMANLLHLGLVTCALTGQIPISISAMTNIQSITIANNQLTGSFPIFLADHPSLVNIQLFGNEMVGFLPSFTSDRLAVLQLQSNRFSGELIQVFTETFVSSSNLNTIDLSENALTGSIPPSLFNIPTLVNLALSSNCFTGSLPQTICSAGNIRTMTLNGLSSNKQCENQRFLPGLLLKDYMHGSIPLCVWSLANLRSFHISGNRFSGEIGGLPVNSVLDELSLSHNHFTGSLPVSIQQKSYSLFDVSYNTFTGNIDDIVVSNTSRTLKTNLNRLSGHISKEFSQADLTTLDILRGNMFDCQNIPSADEHSKTYECGSSNLDNALYFVSACMLFWLIVVAIVLIYHFGKFTFSDTISKFRDYYFLFDTAAVVDSASPNIVKFDWILRKTVYSLSLCSVLGMVSCIPAFIMKMSYGSVSYVHSYTWIFSLAYSSGMWVSIFVLFAWTSLFVAGMYFIMSMKVKKYELTVKKTEGSDQASKLGAKSSTSSRVHVSLLGATMDLERSHYTLILLSLNGVVVLGANALYVYCIFLELSTSTLVFIQIMFAFFILFWKYVVISRFVFNPTETFARRVMLMVWVDVFNSVLAPVLVFLVTDPDCFRDIFIAADEISSSYQYLQCFIFLSNGDCAKFLPVTTTLEPFTPPFIYNYGCSSKLISAYIPVNLYCYSLLIFMVPITYLCFAMCTKYDNLVTPLRNALPGVLWPAHWASRVPEVQSSGTTLSPLQIDDLSHEQETFRSSSSSMDLSSSPFFQAEAILAQLVNHLYIMLTFGLASPPLMVSISVTCFITLVMWKVSLGRFVAFRRDELISRSAHVTENISDDRMTNKQIARLIKANVSLQQIESSLDDIESTFDLVHRPLAVCSAPFISFLCYDIVANDSTSSPTSVTVIPLAALCVALLSDASLLRKSVHLLCETNKAKNVD